MFGRDMFGKDMFGKEMFGKYFPHYSRILNGEESAYYLLCKQIPVEFNETMDTEYLWKLHNTAAGVFKKLINEGEKPKPSDFGCKPRMGSFLDLKIAIANKMLKKCEFCENNCKINRLSQMELEKHGNGDVQDNPLKLGKCGLLSNSYIESAFLHHGEEPPLVPSGTIFFAGCTFDCVFCQNWDISSIGKAISKKQENIQIDAIKSPLFHRKRTILQDNLSLEENSKEIAKIANKLEEKGARNINYVGGDPTPNLHAIIGSMKFQNSNICQLWNSNFYNTINVLDLLMEVTDFWLPDFKYGNNKCGKKYSEINRYWDILTRNLRYIYDWGSREIVIRHLVMPGHFECCTKPILEWIASEIPGTVVNIMAQYRPSYKVDAENYPEINRRVPREEMMKAFVLADGLRIEYKMVR